MTFLHGGRLLALATCDAFSTPAIAPVVSCLVEADRQHITVLLAHQHASRVLSDISAHGQLTLLAAQPELAASIQVRGIQAVQVEVSSLDLAGLAVQRESLAAELLPLGFSSRYGYALSDFDTAALVAVRFLCCGSVKSGSIQGHDAVLI